MTLEVSVVVAAAVADGSGHDGFTISLHQQILEAAGGDLFVGARVQARRLLAAVPDKGKVVSALERVFEYAAVPDALKHASTAVARAQLDREVAAADAADDAELRAEEAAIREEAAADGIGPNGADETANCGPMRWRLVPDVEIEQQPPREDLIADVLAMQAFAALVGPPATAKTTTAMDFSFCVSTGRDWHGHAVRRGPVVFIAAEGSAGLGARVRAWKEANAWTGLAGVHFLPHSVSVMDSSQVQALLKTMDTLPIPPRLVVFDTLARCLVGGEENSARDVGLWIAGADRIRAETGAAVLVVHHTAKASNMERGSGALRGAVDTLFLCEREDQRITLVCDKSKDAAPFGPLRFQLSVVDVGAGVSACVLKTDIESTGRPARLPESRRRALDALADLDHGEGATAAEWHRASGLPERSFHRAIKDLVRWEKVCKTGSRRAARYTIQTVEADGD